MKSNLLNVKQTGLAKKKSQKGFTLTEFVIVVILISIASVAAFKNFGTGRTEGKVSTIISMGGKVYEVANGKYGGVFTGCDMADLEEYLPEYIGDGDSTNPYDGNITCAANSDAYKLDITFTAIPDEAGNRIVDRLGSDASFTAGSGSITVTFGG